MKNFKILMIAVFCIGSVSCIDGQMRKTIYGDGNVVKRERQAGNFTGIRVSSGIDVYLKQTDNESISVETDENLQEYIKTEIRDGILHVYADAEIRKAELKRVNVTMRDIKSISTSSAGDVIGETPVKTDNLKLSASSAGNIKLETYLKEIEADLSSSGDMTLSGEADVLKADLSSAGDLNAYNLSVKEADISVSSAGDADIFVTEQLTARASSAGDINYKGDPKHVDAHSSSAGGVHRK
jgi:citrate lyase gamma subunit